MKLDHSGHPQHRFAPAQERALTQRLRAGEPLHCTECRVPLDVREVPPRRDVPYVRDRLIVACARCHRTAVLDRREGP